MTTEAISSNYASLKYVTSTTKCCLHANTVFTNLCSVYTPQHQNSNWICYWQAPALHAGLAIDRHGGPTADFRDKRCLALMHFKDKCRYTGQQYSVTTCHPIYLALGGRQSCKTINHKCRTQTHISPDWMCGSTMSDHILSLDASTATKLLTA